MVDTDKLLEIARGYKGIPYLRWSPGMDIKEQVFFCTDRIYTREELNKRGINCAALINMIFISLFGLPNRGDEMYGTIWWGNVLVPKIREVFHIGKDYPPGTLLFRRFRDVSDQGHVALVSDNGNLIHSWSSKGVVEEPVVEVHQTYAEGYFEYAILPEDWLKKDFVFTRWGI